MRRLGTLSLLISVGLSACGGYNSRNAEEEAASTTPDRVTEEGVVRVAGSTPMERVMLGRSDGPELELRGEHRGELFRLQGAAVRVIGHPGERNLFHVADYEILEIEGQRPWVGVLQRSQEGGLGVREPTGEWRALESVPAALAEKVGSKVWVVAGPDGSVRSFGILREGVDDSG